MNQIDKIFAALDASGVSVSDFARLTTVSRSTLYKWKDGTVSNIRDRRALSIALAYADKIQQAVAAKRLPLTETYRITKRVSVLRGIISEFVRS